MAASVVDDVDHRSLLGVRSRHGIVDFNHPGNSSDPSRICAGRGGLMVVRVMDRERVVYGSIQSALISFRRGMADSGGRRNGGR